MNRSFRAPERQIQGLTMREREGERQRQQVAGKGNAIKRENEEELALFLEMRKREKERNDLLLRGSEELEALLGFRAGAYPIFNNIPSSAPTRRNGTEDFLNSENDKNDYDWLITPPGTPLFPSLEMESQRTVMSELGTSKARPTALKSRLANPQPELSSRTHLSSRQITSSLGLNTSTIGVRRPSSSGGPGSRPSTPTGRPTLSSTNKPINTTVSKSTSSMSARSTTITTSKSMSSVSKSSSTTLSKPSRSSTPTSRLTLPSIKPTAPPRSSTPTSRPTSRSATPTQRPTSLSTSSTDMSRTTARSSTPTSRLTLPASKPPCRSATPTRRPTSLSTSTNSCPPSSPVNKPGPTTSRNPVPPRASSPTVKPRAWNVTEMPGFSLDAPPNLRTSMPDRPLSSSRGRPGAPSARSSSVEPASNGRVRRQSCSPSRGRPPNSGIKSNCGSSVPAVSRIHAKANESVSPGLIGTKMVERMVNMRRLVPPTHNDKQSPRSNLSGKSSSPDSSGFGRSFSKKSLDMAVRHMDLRKSIQGNTRPRMTNVPASSMYSVRPCPTRSITISISDSPLATSSNASSEMSVNNNGFCMDGSELEDDINSEKGARSPASIFGR